MERLTKRDEYGNADIIGVDSIDLQGNLAFDEFNRVTAALNRLAHYEDLEEQGRLVVLEKGEHMTEIKTQIRPGDVVWWVHCTGKVYKGTVARIDCCEYQGGLYCLIESPSFKKNPTPVVHYSDVFLSREDAMEFAEYQTENPDGVWPICMGCHYAYKGKETANQ